MFSLSVWKGIFLTWSYFVTYFIPLFNIYMKKKTIYFLNGHRNHWLCNAVDFGPEVSCTCIHVILDGARLSCPLPFSRKVRHARQKTACRCSQKTSSVIRDVRYFTLPPTCIICQMLLWKFLVFFITLCCNNGSDTLAHSLSSHKKNKAIHQRCFSWHLPHFPHILAGRAATNDYFHYRLIFQLFSQLIVLSINRHHNFQFPVQTNHLQYQWQKSNNWIKAVIELSAWKTNKLYLQLYKPNCVF